VIYPSLIRETSGEDYTTDSVEIEDSSEECKQIQIIETQTDMFSKHRNNKIISHSDFIPHEDRYLFTAAFSWELNASPIMSQWMPDLVDSIDEIYKYLNNCDYSF